MTVSVAVVAHPSRHAAAERLAGVLYAPVAWDTGHGSNANHDNALRLAMETPADWYLIVEDDAIPACTTSDIADALSVCPARAASLYLGINYPPSLQDRIPEILERDPAWLLSRSMRHGVAMAFHHSIAQIMLDRAVSDWDADQRYGLALHGLSPVAYSNPSLFDHADGQTIVSPMDGAERVLPRKAWRTGVRDWDGSFEWLR